MFHNVAPLSVGSDLLDVQNELKMSQAAFASALGLSPASLRRHQRTGELDITLALAAECLLWRQAPAQSHGYKRLTPEEWVQRRLDRIKVDEETVAARVRSKLLYKAEEARVRGAIARNKQRVQDRMRIAIIRRNLANAIALDGGTRYHEILMNSRKDDDGVFVDAFLAAASQYLPAEDDPLVTLPDEVL